MTKVFTIAIDTFGKNTQIDKAIEEMSELIKELIKERYHGIKYRKSVLEEIVDVKIMLTQLEIMYNYCIVDGITGYEYMHKLYDKKLKYLEECIDESRRITSEDWYIRRARR